MGYAKILARLEMNIARGDSRAVLPCIQFSFFLSHIARMCLSFYARFFYKIKRDPLFINTVKEIMFNRPTEIHCFNMLRLLLKFKLCPFIIPKFIFTSAYPLLLCGSNDLPKKYPYLSLKRIIWKLHCYHWWEAKFLYTFNVLFCSNVVVLEFFFIFQTSEQYVGCFANQIRVYKHRE